MPDHQHTQPIGLSTGLPTTILPDSPAEVRHLIEQAVAMPIDERLIAIGEVVARFPRDLDAWAAFADASSDRMGRYAAARVGYHRGLDALRANGWRGSGYVPWSGAGNRGFLRCLLMLQNAAAAIGEADEAERCALFLLQLDPSGVPAQVGSIAEVG